MIDEQDPCETCGHKAITRSGTCAHEWRAASLFGCTLYQLLDDESYTQLDDTAPVPSTGIEDMEDYPF